MGAVTALGLGVEALWTGALAGRVALAPTALLPERPELPLGAVALEVEAPRRALTLARRAVDEAIESAGWTPALLRAEDTALIVSTTKGNIAAGQHHLEGRLEGGLARFGLPMLASELAASLGCRGLVQTLSLACASGTSALGCALHLLRRGRAARVLVVGVEALCEFIVRGFASLRALDAEAARPFDAERGGLSVGEGAAAITLERGEGVRLVGFGDSNDANHITGPSRDGSGLSLALERALADAGLPVERVGAVSAHGTATRYNDAMEGKAWARLLGAHRAPVHGVKGAIGHTMGAAGLIEAILAARGLQTGAWPPIAGLRTPDPQIDLALQRAGPVPLLGDCVMSSSSGFAGVNSAVVLCAS